MYLIVSLDLSCSVNFSCLSEHKKVLRGVSHLKGKHFLGVERFQIGLAITEITPINEFG